jgi:hypothetical protein
MNDETQAVVEHTDGSQTVELNDSEQTFTEHLAAEPSLNNGRQAHDGGPRH